ncbi:hypothetical protein ABG768_027050 [Culter alburnus]|uniref:Uncharacterized protein n=1 Tax=Culter alburnus TaxID=194366 RepID=A0AAW2AEQ8_CULAL
MSEPLPQDGWSCAPSEGDLGKHELQRSGCCRLLSPTCPSDLPGAGRTFDHTDAPAKYAISIVCPRGMPISACPSESLFVSPSAHSHCPDSTQLMCNLTSISVVKHTHEPRLTGMNEQ